jgi:Skp family chaperone for outer membrane proteins
MRQRVSEKLMTALTVATTCGFGLWAGATTRPAHAAASAEPAKRIGVVSVSRVFKAYKKVADVQKQLEAEFDPRKRDLEGRGKKLKEWEAKLKLGGPPGRNRDKVVEFQKFELEKFDLEKDFRKLAVDVEKKRMEEMKQVLREIRGAIRAVAQAGKYDLILRAPEYDDEGNPVTPTDDAKEKNRPKSSSELVRRFRENPVLFYAPVVDLTQAVVTKLNGDYAGAK